MTGTTKPGWSANGHNIKSLSDVQRLCEGARDASRQLTGNFEAQQTIETLAQLTEQMAQQAFQDNSTGSQGQGTGGSPTTRT